MALVGYSCSDFFLFNGWANTELEVSCLGVRTTRCRKGRFDIKCLGQSLDGRSRLSVRQLDVSKAAVVDGSLAAGVERGSLSQSPSEEARGACAGSYWLQSTTRWFFTHPFYVSPTLAVRSSAVLARDFVCRCRDWVRAVSSAWFRRSCGHTCIDRGRPLTTHEWRHRGRRVPPFVDTDWLTVATMQLLPVTNGCDPSPSLVSSVSAQVSRSLPSASPVSFVTLAPPSPVSRPLPLPPAVSFRLYIVPTAFRLNANRQRKRSCSASLNCRANVPSARGATG